VEVPDGIQRNLQHAGNLLYLAPNACRVDYNRLSNGLALETGAGGYDPTLETQLGAGANPAILQNSQCIVNAAQSSLQTIDANTLELDLAVAFKTPWVGTAQTDYLYVWDRANLGGGWMQAGPYTITAPSTVVTSSPPGLPVMVDGTSYTTPQTFSWPAGSVHTISAAAAVSGTGMQGTYSGWSDGGTATHTITAAVSSPPYIATYTMQYYLTTAVSGTGTVTPPSGWYASGTQVTISATAGSGYSFASFSGTTVSNSSSVTVTMSGPVTETAQFEMNYAFVPLQSSITVSPGATATFLVAAQPAGYTGTIGLAPTPFSLPVTCNSAPQSEMDFPAPIPNGMLPDGSAAVLQVPTYADAALDGCAGHVYTVHYYAVGSNPAVARQPVATMTVTIAVAPTFTMMAMPQAQTALTSTYQVTAQSTNYSQPVSVGLGPGSCANLIGHPTVTPGPGPQLPMTTVSVLTLGCPPGTNTTLTFTGTGTGAGAPTSSTVTSLSTPLTQTAMLSPPPGTNLPGGTTAFSWRPGPGVSQCMLSVGQSPGAGDLFLGGPQTATSATVNVPTTASTVYATLSSLTASGWRAQSYTYAVNAQPGTQALQLNGTPAAAIIPSSGREVLYGYSFSGGDARTITGVQATGVQLSGLRIASATAGSVVVGYTAVAGAAAQQGQAVLSSPVGTVTVAISTDGGDIEIGDVTPPETTVNSQMTASITGFGYLGGDSGVGEVDLYLCQDEFGNGCQEVGDTVLEGASNNVGFTTAYPGTYCLVAATTPADTGSGVTETAEYCPVTFDPVVEAPEVNLNPTKIVTGVGTTFTLTAGVDGSGSYSYAWSISGSPGVAFSQGNCAQQTACSFTAGSSGGTATVTFTVADGSGNAFPTQVPVTVVSVTLTSISWYGQAGTMMKQSATSSWTNDSIVPEGVVPIGWTVDDTDPNNPIWTPAPTWTCCNGDGTPTLSDPVVYQANGVGGLGPLTFTVSPVVDMSNTGATLQITSSNAALRFNDSELTLAQSQGVYTWPFSATSQMPPNIANLDATLTFKILWNGGGSSVIATPTQRIFVTLGPPGGIDGFTTGGSNPRPVTGSQTVTAARVSFVTGENIFGGLKDQSSAMQAAKALVAAPATGLFGLGVNSVGNVWAAISQSSGLFFDCISLSTITMALLQQAGVSAYGSYAFATTDFDATGGKSLVDANGKAFEWLDWYPSSGNGAQAFEAYVFLCSGGTAVEADTLYPLEGPYVALPFPGLSFSTTSDACAPPPPPMPGAPVVPWAPPPPERLALSVIFNILLLEQNPPVGWPAVVPPMGGRQWWVDGEEPPVPIQGPVPFPIQGQGVQ
jgi:hypothetical protein